MHAGYMMQQSHVGCLSGKHLIGFQAATMQDIPADIELRRFTQTRCRTCHRWCLGWLIPGGIRGGLAKLYKHVLTVILQLRYAVLCLPIALMRASFSSWD